MNKEKEVKAFLEGKLSQAEKLKYEIAGAPSLPKRPVGSVV